MLLSFVSKSNSYYADMLFSAWQIEVKWVDTYHTVLDGVKVVWLVFCTQVSLCMISFVGCWASVRND